MKLLFKQRMFSWFDSYDIYDKTGKVVYTVTGHPSWGHHFKIYNTDRECAGSIRERVFAFLPTFDIYRGDALVGSIRKEISFVRPKYYIDFNGWHVVGDFLEWDYSVADKSGNTVAAISKEIFHWTDTYSIDVTEPKDELEALMLVLAIDAEKCTRS